MITCLEPVSLWKEQTGINCDIPRQSISESVIIGFTLHLGYDNGLLEKLWKWSLVVTCTTDRWRHNVPTVTRVNACNSSAQTWIERLPYWYIDNNWIWYRWYVHCGHPNLNFFCCRCSNHSNGTFNCATTLPHIAARLPDVKWMQVQTEHSLQHFL